MTNIIKFLFLVSFFFCQLAFSAIRYSDPLNGSDANSGTIGSPYASLEKCISVSTGGDTCRLANTADDVLDVNGVQWTGYTNNGQQALIIEAYDAGGSITIQRPDELTPRVGASINGNGVATTLINLTGRADYVIWKNIFFQYTAVNSTMVQAGGYWIFDGCMFTSEGMTGMNTIFESVGQAQVVNNYFIFDGTMGYGVSSRYGNYFENNYFELRSTGWSSALAGNNNNFDWWRRNIFVVSGVSGTGTILAPYSNNVEISNNVFITETGLQTIAISISDGNGHKIKNNIFYKFNHASSNTISQNGTPRSYQEYGKNAFYDSNAPQAPSAIRLNVGTDITDTGSPFVDFDSGDYTPIEDLYYLSDDGTDIGAIQHQSAGGGGSSSTKFIIVGE